MTNECFRCRNVRHGKTDFCCKVTKLNVNILQERECQHFKPHKQQKLDLLDKIMIAVASVAIVVVLCMPIAVALAIALSSR